ncbi:hypothetical protein K8Z49_29185 [Actinomadura madurae]|uniref:hypothetical protein n=1 Tax=Actinomadura madurae TaxID=1993 RepID=UPI000D95C78E|nr:hypothetical protein [Actinomadura madurae]SPT60857.1 Uncharacterised protein [Actinomadura madurae]
MSQTRPATPVAGTIALVLVGGAVATGIGVILTFAGIYQSPFLAEFRTSTAYYALHCVVVGVLTAAGLVLTRPRGPAAPIVAAVSALVALYVGTRLGVFLYGATHNASFSGGYITAVLKPRFHAWDLLAPLVAGAVAGLRVAMVAGGTGPTRAPFPQPGPGHRPFPGQPPAPPYQPGPGQGSAPGAPPGWTPPHGGA